MENLLTFTKRPRFLRATNYIVFTTKIGEVIVLDSYSFKMIKRIETGLNGFSQILVESTNLWCIIKVGLESYLLDRGVEKAKLVKLKDPIYAIGLLDQSLIALTSNAFLKFKKKELKKEREWVFASTKSFKTFFINPKHLTLHALSASNELSEFKVDKKELKFMNKIQFKHIGQINCLLWIENHKFVVSAGADKKIGVWQFN